MHRRIVAAALLITACSAHANDPLPTADSTAPRSTRPGAAPADVYVAPDGDDAATGTSTAPVATIERAVELVPMGGTIELTAGVHGSGSLLEGITHVIVRGAPEAVLDGRGTAPFGFFCDSCADVVVEGLEIRGFTDIGVGFTRSTNVTLHGLSVHGNGIDVQYVAWELEGYGIHVDASQRVTISGNDVFDNGPDATRSPAAILGTGINTYGNRDVVIDGNNSHHNRGGGILVEDSERVVVSGNLVEANDLDATAEEWWDGGIWIDGGADVVVTGNVVRDNTGPGIQVSDEEHQSPHGYVLTGNVSTGNLFGLFVWGFGTDGLPSEWVLTMDGNDISGNSRRDIWTEPDL